MRRLKVWLPLVVLVAALTVGARAAVAPQHTSPVTATLTATRVTMQEHACTGDDGQYRQAVETWAGVVTGDPRLTGIAALSLISVVNTTTGNGTSQGLLIVTDPSTQTVKVRAIYTGVVTPGGVNLHGLMTGVVHDLGAQLGGRLVANFQAVQNGPVLYAGIGSTGTNAHPAVIQRILCTPSYTNRLAK
jgi:hypothetical protein